MDLIELKKNIELKVVSDDFIIFLCEENGFIADQYIKAICDINNLTRTNINNLQEQTSALSLLNSTDELRVLITDNFEEVVSDYTALTNTIVVCKKVDKKIAKIVEPFIIKVPKLVDWQVKSYIKLICPTLENEEIDWFYKVTNGDIYRIVNEIDKLLLFNQNERKEILAELRYGADSDLYALTIFDFVEAILSNKKVVVLDYLRHPSTTFEFMSLVSLTLKKAKDILFVTKNSNKSASEIGLTSKQAAAISRIYSRFPEDRLKELIEFLSKIDLKVRTGMLDMPKDALVDYFITNTID